MNQIRYFPGQAIFSSLGPLLPLDNEKKFNLVGRIRGISNTALFPFLSNKTLNNLDLLGIILIISLGLKYFFPPVAPPALAQTHPQKKF